MDAFELEGLEAVLLKDGKTIEWRVKVDNQLGHDYSKTLLQDAADVLSQNGLTVNIIEDANATFTVKLANSTSQIQLDEKGVVIGMTTTKGYTVNDGNVIDGEVVSINSPRTLAHELGHKASLPHIFDATSEVPNTEKNKKNLMNSESEKQTESLRDGSGTVLLPSQTSKVINHVKTYNEDRAKQEEKKMKFR